MNQYQQLIESEYVTKEWFFKLATALIEEVGVPLYGKIETNCGSVWITDPESGKVYSVMLIECEGDHCEES